MTDDRPLDPSTGKPRMISDTEAADLVRKEHASSWTGRDGAIVRAFMLRTGLTLFGKVWQRGEVIEVEIGSDQWIATLDPTTGKSALELGPSEQRERWGRPFFTPLEEGETITTEADLAPSPFDDDLPQMPAPTAPKRKPTPTENLARLYEEAEQLSDGPVRQIITERRYDRHSGERLL